MEPQTALTVEQAARIWTFLLGLWCVCVVVNAGLASLKGRNPWFWALLGLIFGPLAFVILLFKRKRKSA